VITPQAKTCGQSNHVDDERSEPAGEVLDRFLVTGGHTSALYDAIEEAFDLIADFITCLVIAFACRAILTWLDSRASLRGVPLRPQQRGPWYLDLRESSQHLGDDLPPLFFINLPSTTDGRKVHFDRSGIDLQFRKIQFAQLFDNLFPDAVLTPPIKSTPHRIPVPEPLR
jgi:hypothetical protein